MYSFASDQLIDLVNAGALQSVDEMDAALEAYAGKSVADVKSANAPGSVDAATKDGTLYAFPIDVYKRQGHAFRGGDCGYDGYRICSAGAEGILGRMMNYPGKSLKKYKKH